MTESTERLKAALADRYTIERELGAGGMATVYLAHDIKHGRDVAIKVMHEELAAAIGADRFLREIALLAKLQHPHILPLIDSSSDGSLLYYVAPYVRGETLRELLDRSGRLAPAHAATLTAEIADALAYSHREGVVHRDIKPENILLQEGHAVVADFGIARALAAAGGSTLTQAGIAVGTPAYMSPEQATGSSDIDGKSDVYALGCVLFEMLAGQAPFPGPSLRQVIAAHVTTPAPSVATFRSDTPQGLVRVVAQCLAKDPVDRPDAASLAAFLALDGGVVPATGIRVRKAAIAAGVVALAVAGTWWGIGQRDSSASAVEKGAERIAVMPLSAVSDTSLIRLGTDLVSTLSATLDGVGELSTVDASTVLGHTRGAASPLPLAQAREIATRLGAGSVLTGTLIVEVGQVRALVALYPIDSETAIATATALAPIDDIWALTDSLTWQVLRQVWRHGTPPSPVLAGLTTESFEALRTFLDGERLFQKLDIDGAIEKYRRAFEIDTNFVQAYLRYDFARAWDLQDVDRSARDRLLALADKLPERDRLWLEASKAVGPFPARAETWRDLIRRYPDYPPILMSGIDDVIHAGPMYGIDLGRTLPILDHLVKLTPDNADTWYHKGMVESAAGDHGQAAVSYGRGAAVGGRFFASMMRWQAALNQSVADGGTPLPVAEGMAFARALADVGAGEWSGMLGGTSLSGIAERLELVARARREGVYTGEVLTRSYYGEGLLRIARGDWLGGLGAVQRNESSPNASLAERFSTARLATIGAWLGTVDAAVAAGAVARARAMPGAEDREWHRIELRWFEGLMAIVEGDEPRMQRMITELRQEVDPDAGHAARSLHALWQVKQGAPGAADSVRAISDAMMQGGNYVFAAEVVNRFVIARALRTRGQPGDVERYLMWIDAVWTSTQAVGLTLALGPTVMFERGMALEEAGDHAGAVFQLTPFLKALDQPPASQREMIAEARRVVGGTVGRDAPAQQRLKP